MRYLLEDRRIDPTLDENFALRLASQSGHLEVGPNQNKLYSFFVPMAMVLILFVRLSDCYYKMTGLILLHVIILLLGFQPKTITLKWLNSYYKIHVLILPPKVPSLTLPFCLYLTYLGNITLQITSEYGNTELVRLLLSDRRVDPSAEDSLAIKVACEAGNTEVHRQPSNPNRGTSLLQHDFDFLVLLHGLSKTTFRWSNCFLEMEGLIQLLRMIIL